jgi:hypothetical protein
MQALKEQYPDGFLPDEEWFRAFVAKAIIFRTVQSIVKTKRFSAYQANITAYTVASLSWKCGGRLDFDHIWSEQEVSKQLRSMIEKWVVETDKQLRQTAKARMPSEWAKKEQCWEGMRELPLAFPDPLPPELQAQSTRSSLNSGKPVTRNDGLSRGDLELIDRCRRIDAVTWFKVAQWGNKSKAVHWKIAGIAKTVGEYDVSGWERSPSVKQAKWAMEAYKAAEEAGVLSQLQKSSSRTADR